MHRDPTARFSARVAAYVRYRPSYPGEILDLLETDCGLLPPRVVADIGSGTGILTRLFLERGHRVFGVEPNRAMRGAAERLLTGYERFTSIEGAAEHTNLPAARADLVVAAQALHWFDLAAARREFGRILAPDGWVAVIWNDRRKLSTPFLRGLEELLLAHGTDYRQVDHTHLGEPELRAFFAPAGYRQGRFDNRQTLDFEGLRGRLLSSSYAPLEEDPGYPAMIAALRSLFDRHQSGGTVSIDYDTRVYYGRLS